MKDFEASDELAPIEYANEEPPALGRSLLSAILIKLVFVVLFVAFFPISLFVWLGQKAAKSESGKQHSKTWRIMVGIVLPIVATLITFVIAVVAGVVYVLMATDLAQ